MFNLKLQVRKYWMRFGMYGPGELNKIHPISEDEFYKILGKLKPGKLKAGKSDARTWGRYSEKESSLGSYLNSGNMEDLRKAQRLHSNLRKPYRLDIVYGGRRVEYTIPGKIHYKVVLKIVEGSKKFKSFVEFDLFLKDILKYY